MDFNELQAWRSDIHIKVNLIYVCLLCLFSFFFGAAALFFATLRDHASTTILVTNDTGQQLKTVTLSYITDNITGEMMMRDVRPGQVKEFVVITPGGGMEYTVTAQALNGRIVKTIRGYGSSDIYRHGLASTP